MESLTPTTEEENEKLALVCINAIKEHGTHADVAIWDGIVIKHPAAYILAACWNRRNDWKTGGGILHSALKQVFKIAEEVAYREGQGGVVVGAIYTEINRILKNHGASYDR